MAAEDGGSACIGSESNASEETSASAIGFSTRREWRDEVVMVVMRLTLAPASPLGRKGRNIQQRGSERALMVTSER